MESYNVEMRTEGVVKVHPIRVEYTTVLDESVETNAVEVMIVLPIIEL